MASGSITGDAGRAVRQEERASFTTALERSRRAAYAPGEYVGQESFMRAGEIRRLARRARIGAGVSVLDVCCGVAGPGRSITAETGCHYLGVDYSPGALEIARRLSGEPPCRFARAHVPPLPDGPFDVVLLLETMLASPDKGAILGEVARVPDADTVRLVELTELTAALRTAGLAVTWQEECTAAHHATAAALLRAFRADAAEIAPRIGARALDELLAAHRLWCDWLGGGRVRTFALVAEKR